MTIYEISVLTHYWNDPDEDHEDMTRRPPVWESVIDRLKADDLLDVNQETGPLYMLTERGYAYIGALQYVPLPVKRWVTDWPKEAA